METIRQLIMKHFLTILAVMMITLTATAQKKSKAKTEDLHFYSEGKFEGFKFPPIQDSQYLKLGKVFKNVEVKDSTNKVLFNISNNDTAVIGSIKFLKIGDKVIPVEAFKQADAVFLPLQYWQAVIDMLRNATGVNMKPEEMMTLIQAIAQQLPQPKK
jgi:hypothetical protein